MGKSKVQMPKELEKKMQDCDTYGNNSCRSGGSDSDTNV